METEWRQVTLKDCVVINESTYSPKEAWPFINYLDTGNITDNRISDIQHLVNGIDKIPTRARRKCQPGDIVYSTVRPNQRHYGLIKEIPENFLASTGFAVVRGKSGVADTDFIYWFLAQDHIVTHLHSIAETSTTAYPSIRPADLEQLPLSLPPLAQQRAIAHILGTLDDKIDLNRRMNETLEEMARAIFTSWFVHYDPVHAKIDGRWRRGESLPGLPADLYDLFPARMTESELGEIPEEWEVRPLGEVVEYLRNNENPFKDPETMFTHFSIPAHDDGQMPRQELGANIKSAKSSVPSGSVLFSRLNPEIERVWLVDVQPDDRAVCSTEFMVLGSQSHFQRCYIYCLGRTPSFRQQFESLVTGTSKSHQRAPAGAVLSLNVVVPPEHVIGEFETLASAFLNRTLANRRESQTLSAMRDALLPKLVSGEVQVGGCV